jgi:hypothetical protein
MVVPGDARDAVAVAGALLVITAAVSVVGTLMVPRPIGSWLTRLVDQSVNAAFRLATAPVHDFTRRDKILASQAPLILLGQLAAWLMIFFIGYSLLLWPFETDITAAFTTAGPGLWEIGSYTVHGAGERAIQDVASLTGVITVTLQISYLPSLYSAFNRRENEVTLLNARAGVPSWGPELLNRTHYALGSGASTIDTLPDLYAVWERWAADVAESHATYLPLVRFRSPRPLSSWVTALLAVLDSAALFLALSPELAPTVPARLCLRSGLLCLGQVGRAMGLDVPDTDAPPAEISLTYAEFLKAIETLRAVNFPIEREPAEAWPDFVGWRVNYEQAAYAVAKAVDAVPALWSGPRRHPHEPIPPIRPGKGRQPAATAPPLAMQPAADGHGPAGQPAPAEGGAASAAGQEAG